MEVTFDVVISSPDESVDMKTGLDTLQGISNATRRIAEAVLAGDVVQRLNHKSGVRTTLKKTFKGSYGQIYSLDVVDAKLNKSLKSITRPGFVELMEYFLKEAIYEDGGELSSRPQRVVDKLGDSAEQLIQELRTSCMGEIHEVSKKFGYRVKIRHRSGANRTAVGSFDARTFLSLQAEVDAKDTELVAGITRFNNKTGNGRLQLVGEKDTSAFGFAGQYSAIKFEAKKVFSGNLDRNNGLDPDRWKYIRLIANPVRLRDGRVVKYIIKGYRED
ncbi:MULTISPECIES: hypothetical protein [unclassified Stenotrophomonas]|uniref:hypothetical protein n=1 Tax=unclassified Stenotrophomonas TaxID=196198 RepID=UPI003BF78029